MPKSSTRTAATAIPWPKILEEARTRFGIERFRPGQREVLASVFAGKDTLALMPTGAGKSLTYQLPALFLPKPVVVVSPLIALMQDQQDKARQADITVESMNSTLRHAEEMLAEHQIAEHIAQLIYVTPERLQQPEFLAQLKEAGGISLLVVDEAHTIPQWGHDFRPAFRCIGEARKALGDPPVLALTATATDTDVDEILKSLHAEGATRINTGAERPNLFFSVHPTVNNEAKQARILAMLAEEQGTGIIYTASVRSANELYELLTEREISVGHYHGKMTARQREQVQREFMSGVHKVMIATKAFGLGIDKPDIRFVYHFEFPDSLETYYQEAGRAGRDGEPAHAVLLYRLEDKRIQSFFLAGRYPKPHELQAVYAELAASEELEPLKVGKRRREVILNLLRDAKLIRRTRQGCVQNTAEQPTQEALEALLQTYLDRAAHDQARLAEMMHYAETPGCRVQVIRAYFGEPEGKPCLRCDNCATAHRDQLSAEGLALLAPATTLPVPAPEEQPCQHEEVRVVETLHGSYQTTRPEHSEQAAEASFHPGDQVTHQRFGPGKVVELEANMVLVDFAEGGSKRLRADFLQASA